MRILLVDPPFHRFMDFYRFYYPLGLAYMASVLQQAGHAVLVYDAEHAPSARSQSWSESSHRYGAYAQGLANDTHPVWAELRGVLTDFRPDVVGISMLSVKAPSAAKVAAICKQADPGLVIIVGADHPTVFPEIVLREPAIDIVVRGEGEETIVALAAALDAGRELAGVAGIVYRDDGGYRHTPPRALIPDLDALPLPAIDALRGAATYRPLDFGAIMGTRGCPYPCTFCGLPAIWSHKVRYRSVASVVTEIRWLRERWGTEFFSFRDASFTLDRGRTVALCDRILADGLDIEWECTTRADLLTADLWRLLERAGCRNIRLGVESGSPRVLRAMRKNLDLDTVRAAARLLNRDGAYWSAYFMFGTPQETVASIRETMEFIREIDPPFVTVSRYTPLPGSAMYGELEHAGRIAADSHNWGIEGNQGLGTCYASGIPPAEFELLMADVAAEIERRNEANSARLGLTDPRLKL